MKMGGGWHGGHPWGLVGVSYQSKAADGPWSVEGQGLPKAATDEVLITSFNDLDMLEKQFREHGNSLACLITEPIIGSGGFVPARREFLRAARELTEKYGVMLIFDEVITGFRFRAGNAGQLYGVQPDLTTYGKVIGGGMPVAAVAGRADLMDQVGRAQGQKVSCFTLVALSIAASYSCQCRSC